ncbi:hypothetical protein DH2020_041560 [Rehmannia glutinosa]|uniref:Protein TIFY n=1 Tax=Rehmannia glutinosa TaxID=99300 RepID=A0ABR0URB1_REHGL
MSSSRQFSDGRRQGKAPEKSGFAQTCNLLSQYMKEKGTLRDLNLEIGGKVESLEAIVKPGSSLSASPSTNMNLVTNRGKYAQSSPEKQPSMDLFPRVASTDSDVVILEDASNKASTSYFSADVWSYPSTYLSLIDMGHLNRHLTMRPITFRKEGTKPEHKNAQLTIFYSGRVLIFDDYPVEKVRELVSMAKKSSSQMSYGILSNTIQEKPNSNIAVASTSGSREGLPPRPQAGNGKQPVVISSNTCQEKTNSTTSGAVASSSRSGEQEANGSDLPIARRSSLHRFLEKRKDRAAGRGPYQNQEQPAPSSKGDDEPIDLNILP